MNFNPGRCWMLYQSTKHLKSLKEPECVSVTMHEYLNPHLDCGVLDTFKIPKTNCKGQSRPAGLRGLMTTRPVLLIFSEVFLRGMDSLVLRLLRQWTNLQVYSWPQALTVFGVVWRDKSYQYMLISKRVPNAGLTLVHVGTCKGTDLYWSNLMQIYLLAFDLLSSGEKNLNLHLLTKRDTYMTMVLPLSPVAKDVDWSIIASLTICLSVFQHFSSVQEIKYHEACPQEKRQHDLFQHFGQS